jgi:D-amino-acid oxidase
VIGLQSALSLLEAGFKITMIAKHLPGDKSLEYTSPWYCNPIKSAVSIITIDRAGAQWRPHGGPDNQEMMEWDIQSLKYWTSLVDKEKKYNKEALKSGLGVY